jgi:orotidine-5'-phosphate decarboxylase
MNVSAAARERLIVALDVANASQATALVDRLGERVSYYKIGLHLHLDPGLHSVIAKLMSEQKQIFLDFKYFDIPATVAGAVRMAAALGVRFLTVMGQRRIVETAVAARGGAGVKILAVTLLTGTSEGDMRQEFDTTLGLDEFVLRRAAAAERAGADGVISSPNEIRLIRAQSRAPGFLVVTPGIRLLGATGDDQKRTASPYDAIVRGADYLVVGRPILRAADPREATRQIIDEMARALAARAEPAATSQP